jgi:hypothetical protein
MRDDTSITGTYLSELPALHRRVGGFAAQLHYYNEILLALVVYTVCY